jgi:hypothetical protein
MKASKWIVQEYWDARPCASFEKRAKTTCGMPGVPGQPESDLI